MAAIKFTFIAFLLLTSGCATIKSDYTPSAIKTDGEWSAQTVDISFSVEVVSEIGQFTVIDKEDLVSKVSEQLREIGLFKKIVYSPFSKRENKHLHFQLVVSGTKESKAKAYGTLSGLTLMIIPVWLNYYSDMSMFMVEGNSEILSASASEKIVQTLWLPLIVVSPFFNNYVTGNRVINSQIKYLISTIPENSTLTVKN